MVNETILAVIIAFVISAILCPIVIPFLLQTEIWTAGQGRRPPGPSEKQGTPTMGGTGNSFKHYYYIALIPERLSEDYPRPVRYRRIRRHRFPGRLYKDCHEAFGGTLIPDRNSPGKSLLRESLRIILLRLMRSERRCLFRSRGNTWLCRSGFCSGTFLYRSGEQTTVWNFTDGLDGLCTSVTILVATFFTIVAIGENSGISPITGAVVGSLLGFLLFNVYPARVFMGDTGSLALGGFVASSAFMMQMPFS